MVIIFILIRSSDGDLHLICGFHFLSPHFLLKQLKPKTDVKVERISYASLKFEPNR